ncbi:MAG TPA: peptidoglycan-associated lipoprotein Pal [Syntrophales bacterium]|nr:peptidoglycan-associated lipoprotein Pal [Syntrophales bacterium]HNS53576.1 peptidoglycan-associated lipoprotein Pal [Syntrophales bacterium]HQL89084.1 peptidoglycan-associated lipoprotein Pal [Syntrophales bacterium]
MRRKWFVFAIAAVVLIGLSGCATVIQPIPAQDLNPKVKSGALVQKTDNFQMILDTSASMDEPFQWKHFAYTSPMKTTGLEYEQHLARLFNDTIPNLKLTAGLRDFAGKRWLSRPFDTKLWYGMAPYSKEELGKAIYAVNTAGVESPLDLALDAATLDLKPLAGKSAVIIFSDGLEMPKAPASAQAMKAAMKDNICIYAVQIGTDPAGTALLNQVVKAGECGVLVNAKDVETAAGMAAFVERVFLGPPPPAAPAAAAPVVVPPPAAPVPAAPEKLEAIYFDFDKYVIKPEGREAMKRNAEWLQKNPDRKIVVEGNCDERGTNEYNMALGQRRADAGAKYLMDLGIAKDRVSTVSYGEEKPICRESNEECWSRNRRADFVVK